AYGSGWNNAIWLRTRRPGLPRRVIKATRYDMAVISANRHHDRVMAMVSSPKWALLS
ncbi:hypothetical protein PCASD_26900, partial [Puccinia coronata f. sp. avenae]